MAANVEPISILSLDVVTNAASAKARLLMKIDIVKPMPANKPILTNVLGVADFQVAANPRSSGLSSNLSICFLMRLRMAAFLFWSRNSYCVCS